jgi:acyl carrier protein
MKVLDLRDIENILYEVFSVKKFPKKIEELKYEDFNEWDSLGNFNLLLAVEEFYNVRFTTEEITNIRSVKELLYALKSKLK